MPSQSKVKPIRGIDYNEGSDLPEGWWVLRPRQKSAIRDRVINQWTAKEWQARWPWGRNAMERLWQNPASKAYRAELEDKLDDEIIKAKAAFPILLALRKVLDGDTGND